MLFSTHVWILTHMFGKRHTCVKKATQLYVCKCLLFSTHVWEKPLTCLFPPELSVIWGPHGYSIFVFYQTLNYCLRSEPLPYGQHIAIFKSRLTDPRSGVAFTLSQRNSNQIILRKKHFPLKIIAPIWGVKPSPSKRGRRCNGTELLHFHGDEEEEEVGQGRSFGR